MNLTIPSGPADYRRAQSAMYVGLSLLRDARHAAAELKVEPWEFAVRLRALNAAGLNETAVRRLVASGFAEHAHEQIRSRSSQRTFRRIANLALTERSCFVLTPAGATQLGPADPFMAVQGNGHAPLRLLPRWDGDTRQLWYGDQLVKCYRVPACCQETILAAFEEDRWPPRIDDPLPQVPGLAPQDRLHDTVRRLNCGQCSESLAFRRDGTGQGVTWAGREWAVD